jgi:pectinesterase
MNLRLSLIALAAAGFALNAGAAERMLVTAANTLDIARPAETISIPWTRVNEILPHARPQHLVVKDAAGHVLPYQIINVSPEAKDPKYVGVAYSELLFQHDFAPGEKSAGFTIETTEQTVPPFPAKTFGRYVPERLDDFGWENDKIAHRTYGPALAAPDSEHRGKEVLVTSGLDIWFKRVPYPIVDRWYNIGHDHYHRDEGEGIDMYNVGASRGAGGTGIWDGKQLYVGANYKTWKVLANGPVRTIFELSYDGWDAAGTKVSEVKRFTVDAGHYFDRIDSTFGFNGPRQLTAAIGLNRHPSDKGQEVKVDFVENAADKSLVQWVTQKSLGDFGVAVIAPTAASPAFAGDKNNALVLAPVSNGQPLRYYVGAAWTRAGEIKSQQEWQRYVADEAARLRTPVSVSIAAEK